MLRVLLIGIMAPGYKIQPTSSRVSFDTLVEVIMRMQQDINMTREDMANMNEKLSNMEGRMMNLDGSLVSVKGNLNSSNATTTQSPGILKWTSLRELGYHFFRNSLPYILPSVASKCPTTYYYDRPNSTTCSLPTTIQPTSTPSSTNFNSPLSNTTKPSLFSKLYNLRKE